MNMTTGAAIILFIFICLVVGYIIKRVENKHRFGKESGSDCIKSESLYDLNDDFAEHSHGKERIGLVRSHNAYDLSIMRSILTSAGIKTYVKSNYFGSLYANSTPNSFTSNVIFIFNEDSYEAKKLIENYIGSIKRENNSRISAFVSLFMLGVVVSKGASHFKPDLLVE